MSNLVLIIEKNRINQKNFKKKINELSITISPDNINPNLPIIIENNGLTIGIINPNQSNLVKKCSICLGILKNNYNNWFLPNTQIPEGNFALFRSNNAILEIITDFVGSRSIWYYHNETKLIASTSQRAIVYFLQSYYPNEKAHIWFLSSGNLGPGFSWDKRIKLLPPNSVLSLDRIKWSINIKISKILFNNTNKTTRTIKEELLKILKENFKNFTIDFDKWILLLSGGYDSRGVLYFIKKLLKVNNLFSITWGLKDSIHNKKSDAYIANKIARIENLNHRYFITNLTSNESIEKIFKRFIITGEGRLNDMSAYIDGFIIWKYIFESNYYGVIRSDEAFGWNKVSTFTGARRSVGIILFSDYKELVTPKKWGFKNDQRIPKYLLKKKDESIESWRDRLYLTYGIPIVFAALNQIKYAYVEIFNPLISRSIIQFVRKVPDNLRTNKKIWKSIVNQFYPKIAFAKYPSIQDLGVLLKNPKIKAFLIKEIRNSKIIPNSLLKEIIHHMKFQKQSLILNSINLKFILKFKEFLIRTFPWLNKFYYSKLPFLLLDYNLLALRVYIISEMHKLLTLDSNRIFELRY